MFEFVYADIHRELIKCKQDEGGSPEELNMYLQFDLVLSDVSAFLVDGDYHWPQNSLNENSVSTNIGGVSFLPVIDKCGIILKLQQVIFNIVLQFNQYCCVCVHFVMFW